MRAIKLMLLGITFILIGIWVSIIGANSGIGIIDIIALVCPIIGIIFVISGFTFNK